MKIGAQLYTVHDFTKDLSGLEESFKKIADIGYKYVQVSGTCDYEPEWLKEKLDKYGLKCVITHTSQDKMTENPQLVSDNHDIFNCKYLGIGGMPDLWRPDLADNQQTVDNFLSNYKNVMKVFKENGKLLMYHNHNLEFVKLSNNQNMIDYIADRTSPDELGFTIDTYWIQYGGCDPAKFIRHLKGRVPCVHFKDFVVARTAEEKGVRMAPIGYGNLDWDDIIEACQYSGTEYVLVEQDKCYEEDPFDCLKKSFEFLKSKGLEII